MVTVLGETRPRARIEHTCSECGKTIAAGTVYIRQRNVRDDHIWVYKAHEDCHDWSMIIGWDGFVLQDDPFAAAEGAPDAVRRRLLGRL